MADRKWWWPQPTDEEWCARIRQDHPEHSHFDDAALRDIYTHGRKYADTWDHLGDARDDWEKLADDWTRLRRIEALAREVVEPLVAYFDAEEVPCHYCGAETWDVTGVRSHGEGCVLDRLRKEMERP